MHEEKTCPRCLKSFECRVGNIVQCACYGIKLNEGERMLIEDRYGDCLCSNCLLELKNRLVFFQEKYLWR